MAMVELERNMLMTMPGGWKMGQLDPKQPSTTYAEFVEQTINEIVRCLLMPANTARGTSARSNYASARVDGQVYQRMLRVEQSFISSVILDRILIEWLREFFLINPALEIASRYPLPGHSWFYEYQGHVDPLKESRGQEIRLKNNVTNLAIEYALMGRDWEVEVRQRGKEKRLLKELGLTDEDVTPSQNNHDEREEEDEDDDE
jgi:capsid protein